MKISQQASRLSKPICNNLNKDSPKYAAIYSQISYSHRKYSVSLMQSHFAVKGDEARIQARGKTSMEEQ